MSKLQLSDQHHNKYSNLHQNHSINKTLNQSVNHQYRKVQKYLPSSQNVYMNAFLNNQIIKQQLLINRHQSFEYRNDIINLIITFHRKLKLNKFVLFEAISIINRFIKKQESLNKIEMIAITGLILAQKKMSIRKLKIKKWLDLLHLELSQQCIIQHEKQILESLDFNIGANINCLEVVLILNNYLATNEYTLMFCRYLLELSFYLQTDYDGYEFLIGLSCLKLSCHFLSPQNWNQNIIKKLKISNKYIDDCSTQIFNLVLSAKNNYPFVYDKFQKYAYHQVSLIQFQTEYKLSKTPQTSSEEDGNFDRNYQTSQFNIYNELTIFSKLSQTKEE